MKIILIVFAFKKVNCQCDSDSGWYGSDDLGVCYSLGKMTSGETPLVEDVFEAEPYCDSFGARLATIRTQARETLPLNRLCLNSSFLKSRPNRTSSGPPWLEQEFR